MARYRHDAYLYVEADSVEEAGEKAREAQSLVNKRGVAQLWLEEDEDAVLVDKRGEPVSG